MEYLGGYDGVDAETEETSEPAPTKPISKPVGKAPHRLPPKNTAPPKAESKPPAKTTTQTITATKIDPNAPALVDLPTKLTKVVKTMMSLEPPQGSSCDYLIAGAKLYIILGDNKKDLRKGNFKLEEISTLPEGVFPAENYYPRILVAKQKVLGIELWVRR